MQCRCGLSYCTIILSNMVGGEPPYKCRENEKAALDEVIEQPVFQLDLWPLSKKR